MMKILKVISYVLVSLGLLMAPSLAKAQDLSMRVEAGVAVPLTGPQADRFSFGGDVGVRGVVGLGSYVDIGPVVSLLALPVYDSPTDYGTAWGLGGGVRVKRPHNASNTSSGWASLSPWADADLQYVRTGPLNRAGLSVGVGLDVPTSDERNIWVGPYARYLDLVQAYHEGFDNTDAHVFVVGLNMEFGPGVEKKAEPCPEPSTPQQLPPVTVVIHDNPPVVPSVSQDVNMELKEVIQFAWDSYALDSVAAVNLNDVVSKITAAKSFESIKVEGHASSDGQVESNNVLAKKRAQAVVDYLSNHGVPKEKLSATGFGSSVPVGSNNTDTGRSLNRRAEFIVKFVIVKEGK